MLKALVICLALISSISLSNAATQEEWWTSGKSLMLGGGDYEDFIGKDKPIIVNFFSRFSADSQRTAGEWEKIVDKYMNEGNNVLTAMIDGWTFESITEIYGIDILPAYMFFAAGSNTPVKFEGEMTAENMVAFIEKMVSEDVDDSVVTTKDSEVEIMVHIDASTIEAASTEDLVILPDDQELEIMVHIDASTIEAASTEDLVIIPDEQELEIMVHIDANTIEAASTEDLVILPDDQELEIMVHIDAIDLDNADAIEQLLTKIEDEINEQIDMIPPEEKVLENDTVQVTEENLTAEPVQEEMAQEVVEEPETQQVQEELRKEVKVVLNTTLLQSQFQEVQDKADDVRINIEGAITDNAQKIEQLREYINTQQTDMKDLFEEIQAIARVVEEITEKLMSENEEEERSSMLPASRHLEEVKMVINEVKDKMFEDLIGGGERSTPRSILFLIGALGGAAITYIAVNLKNKKNKRLYD